MTADSDVFTIKNNSSIKIWDILSKEKPISFSFNCIQILLFTYWSFAGSAYKDYDKDYDD